MIVYENGIDSARTAGILYTDPKDIRKLAITMLVNAAEGIVDMILDCPAEYSSKPEMDAALLRLNDHCLEALEDHIADLRGALTERLTNMKFRARVTNLEYKKETGALSDVTVHIDVD